MIIKRVNWSKASSTAIRVIHSLNIESFPIPILELLESRNDVTVVTYREFSRINNISISQIQDTITNSRFAGTVSRENSLGQTHYYVIYNDDTSLYTPTMIRFTLAHELGHILLDHFSDDQLLLSRGGINDQMYDALEKEAEAFASELLAPIELIGLGWDKKYIASKFDISGEAAEIKHAQLHKNPWLAGTHGFGAKKFAIGCRQHNIDNMRLPFHTENGKDPISILFRPRTTGYCSNCNALTPMWSDERLTFCPVCGVEFAKYISMNSYFQFYEDGDSDVVKYDAISFDKSGRPGICPNCENGNLVPDTPICDVCGVYLYNRCTGIFDFSTFRDYPDTSDFVGEYFPPCCDNSMHLSGRARFCPYCGAFTTYWSQDILAPFQEEHDRYIAHQGPKLLNASRAI